MRFVLYTCTLFLVSLIFVPTYSFADKATPYLVQASLDQCRHGLIAHPDGGPFSIYLFCDDALGSNIGVINTEPAAGPGKLRLEGTKTWDKWYTYDRFWQEKIWAADVVNFAWSPSFRYLYVATSGIYGNGGFFKLDLKDREYIRLLPNPKAKYSPKIEMNYFTQIEQFNIDSNEITVGIYLYDEDETLIATVKLPIE